LLPLLSNGNAGTAGVENAGHVGHRARLLSRFEKQGLASFADYEIVELLLTFVIPRKDTKPIAKELLRKYKTVYGLLNAAPTELAKVSGMGRRAGMLFFLVRDVCAYCLREKYERRPLLHRKDVEEYLRFAFGARGEEYVAAVYLDNGNNVISTEIVCEGTVNQCAVYPRNIVEQAVRFKASRIILAHNHPGGGATASEADWNITLRLAEICRLLEIDLLDHVIVARDTTVSMREQARWPTRPAPRVP
jgi:DNA repair protein RadC